MKKDELASLLKIESSCLIENEIFHDKLVFNDPIGAFGVEFRGCTFYYDVYFENNKFNYAVKFQNCTFKSVLGFDRIRIDQFDQNINSEDANIVLKGCDIKDLFINRVIIERGIKIVECKIERLELQSIKSQSGGISIHSTTIDEQFDFFDSNIKLYVDVTKSTINCKTRIYNLACSDISFIKSIFLRDLHIDQSTIGSIIFNDGKFQDDLFFRGLKLENLSIIDAVFEKLFSIEMQDSSGNIGTIGTLYIDASAFHGDLLIEGHDQEIHKGTLKFSKKLEGSIYFNSCKIIELNLKGANFGTSLFLNLCQLSYLNFTYFNNYSSISITSASVIGEDSSLNIENSNLGKINLYNVALEGFKKIAIVNSTFLEIITSNVKWFNFVALNKKIEQSSYKYAQNKEVFRQLKFISEKQGNRIDALEFKALEIDSFRKELALKKSSFLTSLLRLDSYNKFILWLGRTNDFGLNWIKPTWLIIALSLVFYFLIVVGASNKLSYVISFKQCDIRNTINELSIHLPALPQLMNPAHNIDNIFPKVTGLSFSVHFLDYTLKLFLAFFIFQIISAFRKYMK